MAADAEAVRAARVGRIGGLGGDLAVTLAGLAADDGEEFFFEAEPNRVPSLPKPSKVLLAPLTLVDTASSRRLPTPKP
jgi:hypothetical protein